MPKLSNGGVPFTPFEDQLPGSCRDYFAIDGWANYTTPDGHWLWVSRDAPLISFGNSPTLARQTRTPKDPHRLLAMLFNNFWYTNFSADEHGIMEFQFDLAWTKPGQSAPEAQAEALQMEPVLLINPGLQEDPAVMQRLYLP